MADGRIVLFTDLDGTLLDHDTYLPGPARQALLGVIDAGVDVVFCSAKTVLEQRALADRLDVSVGFIVENGAIVELPDGNGRPVERRFGLAHREIRGALSAVSAELGIGLRGYGDMTSAEVAEATGLPLDQAALARRRCCTETIVDVHGDVDRLRAALSARNLRLQRGARFWTVQGHHDKGLAAGWVLEWLRADASYGFGDAENDLELLAVVDHPVLVRRPDGTWADLKLEGMTRMDGVGPEGWVRGAELLLEQAGLR